MNWYRLIKLAQIWNVEMPESEEGEFRIALRTIYELEYKYHMLQQLPFEGHPKRKENILKQLESTLTNSLVFLKNTLLDVYNDWLAQHAILNPKRWAESRVNEMLEMDNTEAAFGSFIFDYLQRTEPEKLKAVQSYYHSSQYSSLANSSLYKLIRTVVAEPQQYPNFISFLEPWVDEYKDMLRGELESEGLKEFVDRYGVKRRTRKAAEDYIDSLTVQDAGVDDIAGSYGVEELAKALEQQGLLEDVIKELYQNIIFPLWYEQWSAQGIEETRENIEQIYERLIMASDIPSMSIAINVALQGVHQSGSMLDYVEYHTGEGDLKTLFDSLSNTNKMVINVWNEELRGIGTQAPTL